MANDLFYHTDKWLWLRKKVKARWKREGHPCGYCGESLDWSAVVIVDHIHNRKKFPDLALVEDNLQVVHHGCNTRKAAHHENINTVRTNVDGFPDGWK